MRFLFKCLVGVCVAIASVLIVNFNLVPEVRAENTQVEFVLTYNSKAWKFNSTEFENSSKIFTINSRIENKKLDLNNRKILINKLINAKIPPKIIINYLYNNFENKLNKIAKNIEKTPKNAEIIAKNEIKIKNEIIGIKINYELLYQNILNKLMEINNIKLEIPVIKNIPQITSKILKEETFKRGEFSTSIASSTSARKHNVRQALKSINGTKLTPNQTFSFNQIVGRRTQANGYREAKIIVNGEFVEGVGGGVCQVSTTLYNAVLLSGLKIIKSQKHSQRVGYVKGGFDAMVNFGSSDLVFENNTNHNIYILAKCVGNEIQVKIYGESLNEAKYLLENEVVDKIECDAPTIVYDYEGKYADKVKYIDDVYEFKRAKNGYTILSYRTKIVDGQVVEKQLLRRDKYAPQNQVLIYGTEARMSEDVAVN